MIQPRGREPPLLSVPIWPNQTHSHLPWLLILEKSPSSSSSSSSSSPTHARSSITIFILCLLESCESNQ
ncbi:hypothetical protein DY000_02019827 [Brassica cretica]|uniref:Uncharacterized protein n=1 Tax=Brassica cretica TaxID=69181 RepID=A0ABQ7D8N6_BRACR|nr:hypothetical protein DY000_02019827 [Brassica cretica]